MGIAPDQYQNFTMLKKRLIDIPVQEINEKTDLLISYHLEKFGRVAEAIIFEMTQKEPERL
jgi:plasmid replication initiation protein